MTPEVLQYHNDDLVLRVSHDVDRSLWDESRYEDFIEAITRGREYQREAILTALRYVLGGQYESLRELARQNFDANPILQAHFGSWNGMLSSLQLPDQLSASIDLATATGKSFVLYAIAAVLLAEGVVDSVLVLCPSLTIEDGLGDKFRALAEDPSLRSLLPEDSAVSVPTVINANQTITSGSICIENYHAILETTRSSVRDSLKGKGVRVAVLNDEAHHVANASGKDSKRWKEFLTDPDFGFRIVLGASGTCYIGDDYFSDVIYRYSLRQAIEEDYAKRVDYVDEMAQVRGTDERWQLIGQVHERARKQTARYGIRPLTIVVTKDISRCKAVAEQLVDFLQSSLALDEEDARRRVLTVYNNAPDVPKLKGLDDPSSAVEWVVSVSMLNEGWDVKRVFAIVPHDERAFDSKLLIAQVLGRGLRIPETIGKSDPQPYVTVLNHEAWAPRIRHLVNEVLEDAQRLTSSVLIDSPFHFDLHTIDYDRRIETVETPFPREASFLDKGFVDLSSDAPARQVDGVLVDAVGGRATNVSFIVEQMTYDPATIAEQMWQRLGEIDETNAADGSPTAYHAKLPQERLEAIVRESINKVGDAVVTERNRQRILASMGVLNRGISKSVRWVPVETRFRTIPTSSRQGESVSAQELRSTKSVFYGEGVRETLDDRQKPFFDEVNEEGSGYRTIPVRNAKDFKTPVNLVIADSENEKKFVQHLKKPESADVIDAWLKSVPVRFYDIDYTWRKGEHQKQRKFSPDFFVLASDVVLVAEVKGDEELLEPSLENVKKNQYAVKHFEAVNKHLKESGEARRYKFTFVTPKDFDTLFARLRECNVVTFRSELDLKLEAALGQAAEQRPSQSGDRRGSAE